MSELPPIRVPPPDKGLSQMTGPELRALVRELLDREPEVYEHGFVAGLAAQVRHGRWGGDA
jgi:hypothetical protein